MIVLSLPYPPSANRIWRNVRGKTLKSAEYRTWLASALVWIKSANRTLPLIRGPYRLTVTATRPDRRARDLDNLLKPISDCLTQAGVIEDDSNAASILLAWSEAAPIKGGAISIVVEAA